MLIISVENFDFSATEKPPKLAGTLFAAVLIMNCGFLITYTTLWYCKPKKILPLKSSSLAELLTSYL